MIHIRTTQEFTSPRLRSRHWSAVLGDFTGHDSDPIGWGETTAQAIDDLLVQIEDRLESVQ